MRPPPTGCPHGHIRTVPDPSQLPDGYGGKFEGRHTCDSGPVSPVDAMGEIPA